MQDIKITMRTAPGRTDKYTATWRATLKRWEISTDYYKIKAWPEGGEIKSNLHSYDPAYTDKAQRVRDLLVREASQQLATA